MIPAGPAASRRFHIGILALIETPQNLRHPCPTDTEKPGQFRPCFDGPVVEERLIAAGGPFRIGSLPLLGSMLLGIFDADGRLNHVGVTASFTAKRRAELIDELAPLRVSESNWSAAS